MSALDDLQEDIYKNLMSVKQTWPKNMSYAEKTSLLEGMIDYWESQNDYSKCQALHNLKLKLVP